MSKIFNQTFYKQEKATLEVLNELRSKHKVIEESHYENGEFLTFVVIDDKDSQHILSKVIKDFNKYMKKNKETFVVRGGGIDLSLLHYHHKNTHENEIFFSTQRETFYIPSNALPF